MKTLSKLAKICSFCLLALVLVSIISTKTASAASSVTAKKITFKVDGVTYKTTTVYTTTEYNTALYYTKPAKNGYDFAGWYSSATGGIKADSSHIYYTVYAHWNPKSYTITFNGNGPVATTTKTAKYGTSISLPCPNRGANYTCLGWAKSSAATKPDYPIGKSYTVNGNATLYAVWHLHTSNNCGNCSHNARCTVCGADLSGTKNSKKHCLKSGSAYCQYCGKEITYLDYLYAKGISTQTTDNYADYLRFIGIDKNLIPTSSATITESSFAQDFSMWEDIRGMLATTAGDATIKLLLNEKNATTFSAVASFLSCGKDLVEMYKKPDSLECTKHLISFSTGAVSAVSSSTAGVYFNIFSTVAKGAFFAEYYGNSEIIKDCDEVFADMNYVTLDQALRMCIYVYNNCGKNYSGKYVTLNSKDCPGFDNSDKFTFYQARNLFLRILSKYGNGKK